MSGKASAGEQSPQNNGGIAKVPSSVIITDTSSNPNSRVSSLDIRSRENSFDLSRGHQRSVPVTAESIAEFNRLIPARSPKQQLSRRLSQPSFKAIAPKFGFTQALDDAQNTMAEDEFTLEARRVKLKKYLANSTFGFYYETLFVVLSVVSCLEYIYGTYVPENTEQGRDIIAVNDTIELWFACIFLLDWLLQLFLADRKMIFISSFYSMIDLLTVIPIFITYWLDSAPPHLDDVNDAYHWFLYILYALNTTRILRALRIRKKLLQIEDAVDQYFGEMVLAITLMVVFFSGVMQYLEKTSYGLQFHTWMYFVWVTISTVGYGDISPATTMGRFFSMIFIAIAIISVPKMTNELIEKMALQSVYARAHYHPKGASSEHVVICGDLSSTNLTEFFEELFHEDHENADLSAVVLLPMAPNKEFILLMRNPKYTLSVYYLEGSPLKDVDLKRALAEQSSAVFIMSNKFTNTPDEEDAKNILQSLSIHRYLESEVPPSMRTPGAPAKTCCMQLIRPDNLRHLDRDDSNMFKVEKSLVVCLNAIKMGVLAKALVYPGANILLMNLISTYAEDDLPANDDEANENNASKWCRWRKGGNSNTENNGNRNSNASKKKLWMDEYMKGCDWEIYTTELSDIFEDAKFSELSYALYNKLGVVLFALQIREKRSKGMSKLFLNPSNFRIPSKKDFQVEAFVIAKNKADSDLSFADQRHSEAGTDFFEKGLDGVTSFAQSLGNIVKRDQPIGTMFMKRGSEGAILSPDSRAYNDESMTDKQKLDAAVKKHKEKIAKDPPKKESKWNLLKRSTLLQKKVQASSLQEIMQNKEDTHFAETYYLRRKPAEIKDVTVSTNILEEFPYINNHLIVVGKGLRNLYDLIRPLRARYQGPLRYIVILSPTDIPYHVWQRISMFDAVLFVRGSPLEENNLRRAGIFRAQKVVVLASGVHDSSTSNATDNASADALVDSDAIFTYQCVKRMNPQAEIVVEIVNQASIGYLVGEGKAHTDFRFSEPFAAGSLFTTALLDSLVCQAFYNPTIIKVVNKLISGMDTLDRQELYLQSQKQLNESNNKAEDDESDDDDEFNTNMAGGSSNKYDVFSAAIREIEGSFLYQVPIPDKMVGKKYTDMFQYFAMQGIIPLGLQRGVVSHLGMGNNNNRTPYVYTNPEPDAPLYSCDKVFVLSVLPLLNNGKLSIKDWLLDIQMQKQQAKMEKETENSLKNAALATENFLSLGKSQKKLESRVKELSNDVNKKFDYILSALGIESNGTGGAKKTSSGLWLETPPRSRTMTMDDDLASDSQDPADSVVTKNSKEKSPIQSSTTNMVLSAFGGKPMFNPYANQSESAQQQQQQQHKRKGSTSSVGSLMSEDSFSGNSVDSTKGNAAMSVRGAETPPIVSGKGASFRHIDSPERGSSPGTPSSTRVSTTTTPTNKKFSASACLSPALTTPEFSASKQRRFSASKNSGKPSLAQLEEEQLHNEQQNRIQNQKNSGTADGSVLGSDSDSDDTMPEKKEVLLVQKQEEVSPQTSTTDSSSLTRDTNQQRQETAAVVVAEEDEGDRNKAELEVRLKPIPRRGHGAPPATKPSTVIVAGPSFSSVASFSGILARKSGSGGLSGSGSLYNDNNSTTTPDRTKEGPDTASVNPPSPIQLFSNNSSLFEDGDYSFNTRSDIKPSSPTADRIIGKGFQNNVAMYNANGSAFSANKALSFVIPTHPLDTSAYGTNNNNK